MLVITSMPQWKKVYIFILGTGLVPFFLKQGYQVNLRLSEFGMTFVLLEVKMWIISETQHCYIEEAFLFDSCHLL